MKYPHIPKKLQRNQRILTDEQIKEAKEMLKDGNSQRWVAKHFKVSRSCIVRHCVPGMKEYFQRKSREWDIEHPNEAAKRRATQALRTYHLLSKLYPKKMKQIRKESKEKTGKEYFRLKQKEFRKRHPKYWKKFYKLKKTI
jgi:hypothetical protein